MSFNQSQARADIIEPGSGLARIHFFVNRLPRMHSPGWAGPRTGATMVLAWFVWQRSYAGKTEIDRIW